MNSEKRLRPNPKDIPQTMGELLEDIAELHPLQIDGPPAYRDEFGNMYTALHCFGKHEPGDQIGGKFFNAKASIRHYWFEFVDMQRGFEDEVLVWRQRPQLEHRADDHGDEIFIIRSRLLFRKNSPLHP